MVPTMNSAFSKPCRIGDSSFLAGVACRKDGIERFPGCLVQMLPAVS